MLDQKGLPQRVNTPNSDDQIALATLRRPDGAAWIIYQTLPVGQDKPFALSAQRVDAAGNPSGTAIDFTITGGTSDKVAPQQAQCALLADGSFAFLLTRPDPVVNNDLLIYRFSATGAPIGNPTTITDVVSPFGATLTARADGGYDVIYALSDPNTGVLSNHIVTFNAAGSAVTDVTFNASAAMDYAQEAFDNSGQRVTGYVNSLAGSAGTSINVLFPGSSVPASLAYPQSTASSVTIFRTPFMRMAPDGSAYMAVLFNAYDQNGTLTSDEVRVYRFQSGQPAPTLIATIPGATGANAQSSQIDDFRVLPDDTFAITYETQYFGYSSKVYLAQYSLGGAPLGNALQIATRGVTGAPDAIYGGALLAALGGRAADLYLSSIDSGQSDITRTHFAAPLRPSDFNGDGHSDILFRRTDGLAYLFSMNDNVVVSGATLATQVSTAWQIKGVGDFNGDGTSDLLWVYNNPSDPGDLLNGISYITFQNGPSATAASTVVQQLPTQWQVAGVGDFDGDGRSDVLYRNSSSGLVYLDLMDGASVTAASGFTSQQVTDPRWQIAAVGDFDGDGKADIIWRYDNASNAADPLNGVVYEWTMNGTTVLSTGLLSQQPGSDRWTVAGTGDFDGDGKKDLLFRYENLANAGDSLNGFTYVDFLNGTAVTSGAPTQWQVDNSWAIASIGDFNRDGMSDILFQKTASGDAYLWDMQGVATTSGHYTTAQSGPGWYVQNGVLVG